MYSAVYKCVCKQYSDRLYSDVMDHIGMIVSKWASHLSSVHADIQPEDELPFVKEFHSVLSRYFHALSSIVPIFTYMVSYGCIVNGDIKVATYFFHIKCYIVLK